MEDQNAKITAADKHVALFRKAEPLYCTCNKELFENATAYGAC